MQFEWDEEKERANFRKHGVDFSLAQFIATDPLALHVYDRFENGEHRFHIIGMVRSECMILVHAYPDPDNEGLIRVISIRRATSRERRHYEARDDNGKRSRNAD